MNAINLYVSTALFVVAKAQFADATPKREPAPASDPGAEERLADLAAMYAAGDVTRAEWLAARVKVIASVAPPEPAPYLPPPVKDLAEVWESLDPHKQHRAATAVLREVRVRRSHHRGPKFQFDRVTFEWRQ